MSSGYQVDKESGLIVPSRFVPSPNHDTRPDPTDISLLVIHGISLPPGEFGGDHVERFFTNRLEAAEHPYFVHIHNVKVSSHLFIRRDGELVQFVPLHLRAWHAGQSEFKGRATCNNFSIGIELEGLDAIAYSEDQYQALAGITQALLAVYPGLSRATITGHSDIAPGRKTDPGPAFRWQYFRELIE